MSSAEPTQHADIVQIVREHGPYVWRVLRRLGVAESDVDDVCQEVFLVVHRKLADFEARSTLRTWVYGIAVRTASDYRKRAHVRREIATADLPDVPDSDDPSRSLQRRQARALLDELVGALDEDKRAVFILFEIEQLGMADVAAALGCPLQTAYSRLHAARAQVQAGAERHRAHAQRSLS